MPPIHPLLLRCFESAGIDTSALQSSGSTILDRSTSTRYFARKSRDVPQITGEHAGLRAMAATAPDLVPKVIGFQMSEDGQQAGMVSQHFELGSAPRGVDVQRELARKLARMHRAAGQGDQRDSEGEASVPDASQEGEGRTAGVEGCTLEGQTGKYGFPVPTHCGATQQDNSWEESWEVFFRDRRLGDLVRRIGDRQISGEWERMQKQAIPLLLSNFHPPARPVILHGDLWSGNKGYDTTTSSAAVYDPACYYGHNEADLGIMHMFGGFSCDFFDEYHKHHPKSQPYYEERQKLYELYHHLNHTLMFGGGYKNSALRIMRSLTAWAATVDPNS